MTVALFTQPETLVQCDCCIVYTARDTGTVGLLHCLHNKRLWYSGTVALFTQQETLVGVTVALFTQQETLVQCDCCIVYTTRDSGTVGLLHCLHSKRHW